MLTHILESSRSLSQSGPDYVQAFKSLFIGIIILNNNNNNLLFVLLVHIIYIQINQFKY